MDVEEEGADSGAEDVVGVVAVEEAEVMEEVVIELTVDNQEDKDRVLRMKKKHQKEIVNRRTRRRRKREEDEEDQETVQEEDLPRTGSTRMRRRGQARR